MKFNNVHGGCKSKHICKIHEFWTADFILLFCQPSDTSLRGKCFRFWYSSKLTYTILLLPTASNSFFSYTQLKEGIIWYPAIFHYRWATTFPAKTQDQHFTRGKDKTKWCISHSQKESKSLCSEGSALCTPIWPCFCRAETTRKDKKFNRHTADRAAKMFLYPPPAYLPTNHLLYHLATAWYKASINQSSILRPTTAEAATEKWRHSFLEVWVLATLSKNKSLLKPL